VSAASRKQRGAATQTEVARWFAAHGWPYAESTGAGRTGSDITGVPGLACEVKARREFSPLAWIRQAAAGSAGLPFVVHRPDGMGPASVEDWPVTLRLHDFTELLQSAGYGDGEPAQNCPACREGGVEQTHEPYPAPVLGDSSHRIYIRDGQAVNLDAESAQKGSA